MRNHSARVVLAACLAAASIAAQAPVSLLGSLSIGNFDSRLGVDEQRSSSANDAAPRSQPRTSSAAGSFDSSLRQQGDNPYSMWAQYRQAHGEFLDRMERYDPQIEAHLGLFPNERIHNEPGNFDLYQYGLDAEVPVLVSTESYLLFGAYAKSRHYTFSSDLGSRGNAPGVNLDDETLTATGVKLGVGVFLADNWLFEAKFMPGIWSDLDGSIKHQDLDFPGEAMVTVRTLPSFFFKFGARYNQVYRDAPWLPILGFSWEVMESLRVDLLLPEHLEVSVWPNSNLGLLWGIEVDGAEYHVRTSQATGSQQANLRVQEVTTYLGMMSRFDERTSLQLRAGLVVSGDYNLTTGAAGFDHAEGSLGQGFFADMTFGFDF